MRVSSQPNGRVPQVVGPSVVEPDVEKVDPDLQFLVILVYIVQKPYGKATSSIFLIGGKRGDYLLGPPASCQRPRPPHPSLQQKKHETARQEEDLE